MNGFTSGREYRLGSPFGIPLTVQSWLAFLVLAIVGFAVLTRRPEDGTWIAVLFLSILLHEWGHAFAARAAGDRVLRVTLNLLGGHTLREGRTGDRWSFRIAAAGPLVNVVLAVGAGAAFYSAGRDVPYWAQMLLAQAYWANLVLAGFNLLPIFPMDGGHMTRIALSRRVGADAGARLSLGISLLALLATVVWFAATGYLDMIVLVILGQIFAFNLLEIRRVGPPSLAEARAVRARWREARAERRAERRAEERRGQVADREAEALREGPRLLRRAAERGIGALAPEERRLLLLHRRLIEIRVDSAPGEPAAEDLELLELHVRLGASTEVH